jgi:predicted metalloprotease with PDZ domain
MKWIFTFLIGLCSFQLLAETDQVVAVIDLNTVANDRVKVTINVPDIRQNEVVYALPKIVPGTYSIYDLGRFVQELTALDAEGKALPVERLNKNEWRISDATRLATITYWVDDTYDMEPDNPIFEPAGTNIEAGENYLINTFGMVGFLQGYKHNKYELQVLKPEGFYGVTPLYAVSSDNRKDVFTLAGYDHLADSPIMYSVPDTATAIVGGAEVLIGVYSPNKVITAAQIMDEVDDLLEAQESYLGGKLPVDKYAFLFYFTDTNGVSGGLGALEHMNSSVYYLPEMPVEHIGATLKDVCAHEFFHIVTPLNIHSHEIADFNFSEPEMSKHLWLYEGQTEYAAHHAQVRAGLISQEEFIERMADKIAFSREMYTDDLSFTEMSEKCLDEHQHEYGNVYQKGALINMCLDLELLRLSNGTYGTPELMRDLGQRYGQSSSFDDEELFDVIASVSHPDIRSFFANYVEAGNPIPYENFLAYAGVNMSAGEKEKKLSLGHVSLNINSTQEGTTVMEQDISNMNEFGKEMGYRAGDRIVSINGIDFTEGDPMAALEQWQQSTDGGDPVVMKVERTKKNRKTKLVTLKGTAMEVEVDVPGELQLDPNATQAQLELRKAWLQG